MRHIIIFAATIAAALALAVPARAGMEEGCEQDRDPDLKIGGCTAVIRSGEWQGKNLAWAYNNRGISYRSLNEHRRAIEDYDQALRLGGRGRGGSGMTRGEWENQPVGWIVSTYHAWRCRQRWVGTAHPIYA